MQSSRRRYVLAGSADRTPPRTAYEIARQAKAELDALLAGGKK